MSRWESLCTSLMFSTLQWASGAGSISTCSQSSGWLLCMTLPSCGRMGSAAHLKQSSKVGAAFLGIELMLCYWERSLRPMGWFFNHFNTKNKFKIFIYYQLQSVVSLHSQVLSAGMFMKIMWSWHQLFYCKERQLYCYIWSTCAEFKTFISSQNFRVHYVTKFC